MTKEREMLKKLVDSMQFHMPDPHLVAEAQALLAEDELAKVWEPSRKGFVIPVYGQTMESTSWDKSWTDFGHVYPTKQTAEYASVAMRRHNRLLCYALTHWPELEQPGSFADIKDGDWWTVYQSDKTWYPGEWHTYVPGMVYFRTEAQAKQICDALNSGELVL